MCVWGGGGGGGVGGGGGNHGRVWHIVYPQDFIRAEEINFTYC